MRLKEYAAERMMEGEDISDLFRENDFVEEETKAEEFFTYGPNELKQTRLDFLAYSIPRAMERHKMHTNELDIPFVDRKKLRYAFYKTLKVLSISYSRIMKQKVYSLVMIDQWVFAHLLQIQRYWPLLPGVD